MNTKPIPHRRPTVVMVTPYFPPNGGGLERYAYEIGSRLSKNYGWRVVFITSGERYGKDVVEQVEGFTVYRLRYRLKLSNTSFSFGWFKKISKIIQSENPDIVNVHMPVPGIGDVAALCIGPRPLVVTYHAGSMKKQKLLPDILIWLYEHGRLQRLLRRADHIICSSDFVRHDFLKRYAHKSTTITPAVDTTIFKPSIRELSSTPTMLFVGGLGHAEQHKGLKVLLDAMKLSENTIANLSLIVVGSGDMRSGHELYAARLGLKNQVIFKGRLGGENLVEAFQRASMLILPSYAPAESFGMVLIEAMACKLAVIGTRMGGIPTVISEGVDGLLIPPNDAPSLAEAIQSLFKDRIKLAHMGENGFKKVTTKYVWEKKVETTDALLRRILS